jgi:hypothetical protein
MTGPCEAADRRPSKGSGTKKFSRSGRSRICEMRASRFFRSSCCLSIRPESCPIHATPSEPLLSIPTLPFDEVDVVNISSSWLIAVNLSAKQGSPLEVDRLRYEGHAFQTRVMPSLLESRQTVRAGLPGSGTMRSSMVSGKDRCSRRGDRVEWATSDQRPASSASATSYSRKRFGEIDG